MSLDFSRRLFLSLSVLLGAGSLALLGRGLLRYFSDSGAPEPPARFPVGTVPELRALKNPRKYHQGVWLVRDEGGWYALLNRCTHLGCQPALDPQARLLVCPCHGSRFDLQGRAVKGPALRPLARPALYLGPREEVWVDTKKEADPAFRLRL
ncbi:MAG: ubiquinol-cytochrome c reductase iron-sulfur subunit [Desulfobacterota bacterium]|jgi:Rieske Fe-S protein|nr:ubiquinol-cytochrome c reductase iron-sulfur subunit [Thermodesulfobacteriota bacterium]